MLILTRKLGEAIRIGDNITITISDIKGKQIRIGIEAPEDVLIHREEVYTMIQKQNIKALQYTVEAEKNLPDLWNQLMEKKEDGE